jgi:dual oxidase maturation factor 1
MSGSIIVIVDLIYPHKFSTILELDYDTPYDRHIIIEESHDTKRKKPRLEEPFTAGFGSKIFR